jgi:hypothetical protein
LGDHPPRIAAHIHGKEKGQSVENQSRHYEPLLGNNLPQATAQIQRVASLATR